MMINPRERIESSLERMELPSQVIGASVMELFGNRQVIICGHKGIRLYQQNEIIIEMADHAVDIQGDDLAIVSMRAKELMIRGCISSVRFIR